jgi:signal transduction histidine kinase
MSDVKIVVNNSLAHKKLEKIWIRLGLCMTLFVLVTISIIAVSVEIREQLQFRDFLSQFPASKQREVATNLVSMSKDTPELCAYLTQFAVDGPNGFEGNSELSPLIIGLIISLLVGIIVALILARMIIKPIASIAEAASRIAEGNLTVRAHARSGQGELTTMITNFNHMANALENLERERKATAAAISHELRTPLTILNGRLHALCDGMITPSIQEYHKLLDQTQHLVRLVEDVHVLGLDHAEKLTLYRTELDLETLIKEIAPMYSERATEYGMQLEIRTESAWVSVDRDRMSQIVTNLVENAFRYARSGQRVQLSVVNEEQNVILEVRDFGGGLPQGMNERIFDTFFRLDQSRSRATGGSGLGLAVVRSLVVLHDGTVRAYNHADGGAVFRVTLHSLVR